MTCAKKNVSKTQFRDLCNPFLTEYFKCSPHFCLLLDLEEEKGDETRGWRSPPRPLQYLLGAALDLVRDRPDPLGVRHDHPGSSGQCRDPAAGVLQLGLLVKELLQRVLQPVFVVVGGVADLHWAGDRGSGGHCRPLVGHNHGHAQVSLRPFINININTMNGSFKLNLASKLAKQKCKGHF